jgi:hypothetical protein
MKLIRLLLIICCFFIQITLLSQQNESKAQKLKIGNDDPKIKPAFVPKADYLSKITSDRIRWKGYGPYGSECIMYDDSRNPISFNISIGQDTKDLKNVILTLNVWDVDETQGEVDVVAVNGVQVGILHGANNSWSRPSYSIDPSILRGGTPQSPGKNEIMVQLIVSGWCVGLLSGEISAEGGEFSVTEFIPGSDKLTNPKSPDIRLRFNDDIDLTSVSSDNLQLRYRGIDGANIVVPATALLSSAKNILVIQPGSALLDGVKYTLYIMGGTKGLKSAKGGMINGSTFYQFGTVPDLTIEGPDASTSDGLYVIQTTRTTKQIRNKPCVFRIYTKWDKKPNVYENSQYSEINTKVTLKDGSGTEFKSSYVDVKRRDLINIADNKKEGTNSINIYTFWPASMADGSNTYEVELEPQNQFGSNTLKYNKKSQISIAPFSKTLKVEYHYLLMDKWKTGVDAAAETRMDNLMSDCKVFFRDNFPVTDIDVTKGVNINVNNSLTNYSWPKALNFPVNIRNNNSPYLDTVNSIIKNHNAWTTKGADVAFVGLIPKDFGTKSLADGWLWDETNFTGVSSKFDDGTKIILLRDDEGVAGSGANATTVPHEFGHNYNLSYGVTSTSHTRDQEPTEGFWVSKKKNKSSTEGNTDSDKLYSLMCPTIKLVNTRWIWDPGYEYLYDKIATTASVLFKTEGSGPHLFISGGYNYDKSFYVSPIWESEYSASTYPSQGDLSLILLTASGSQIATYAFNSFAIRFLDGREDTTYSFSIIVPSPSNLGILRIQKGSTILKEIRRTANAPQINITSPVSGVTWRGTQPITWTGSDADGDKLLYRLYFSSNNGSTWQSLAANYDGTSFSINTNQLSSGRQCKIKISANDGLNTSHKEVSFIVDNGLGLNLLMPPNNSTNTSIGNIIEAVFTNPVPPSQINNTTFLMRETNNSANKVSGSIQYIPSSRTVRFTPDNNLKFNTKYTVTVKNGITDSSGNTLKNDVEWSFTTEPDNSVLRVDSTDPNSEAVNFPLNGIINVIFSKDLDTRTLTTTSFKVSEVSSQQTVIGNTNYNSALKKISFTPNNLKHETEYKVFISTALKSSDSKSLSKNYEYIFTTGNDSIGGIQIAGKYNDLGIDNNNDGKFESLAIDITVNILKAGSYSINGRLADTNNNEIVWSSLLNQYLQEGITTLRLEFDGKTINAYTTNGPYLLTDLQIYSSDNPDINDGVSSAYKTKTYRYTDFQTSNIPAAINLYPPDLAKGVASNTTVSVTFTRDMRSTTIDTLSFYLNSRTGKKISSKVTYNSATRTATLTPLTALQQDSSYTAMLTTRIKDTLGTTLLKQYNWSFTIGKSITSFEGISEVISYPNPFPHSSLPTGGMYFTYILSASGGKIKLKVYTISGELVKEITEFQTTARQGYNQVYWDGRNEANNNIASGTYLYIVYYQDANGSESRKTGKITVIR